MIKIPQSSPRINQESAVHSLDSLVESLCESYAIPSSLIPEMKSGLETSLTDYLSKFISDHSISKINESTKLIDLAGKPSIESIVESIRFNNAVKLIDKGSDLVSFRNQPDGIMYEFSGFDPNNLSSEILLESWKSDDPSKLIPMITEIMSYRKES